MQPPIRQGDIPGIQLRHETRLELAPDELWRWISEPELMARWLADSVEAHVDGEPGWLLRGPDGDGGELVEDLRGLVMDGDRLWVARLERLSDNWESATRLTLRVQGTGPSDLSVLQQGFERLNLSRCLTIWELYRRRWRAAFERLTVAASG